MALTDALLATFSQALPSQGGLQGSLASMFSAEPSAFPFSRSPPHLRWVEPVFVQISYNGKVLVERTKIFPNGSQRKHSTVLAEKKAHGKCVDLLMLLEARSWLAASHCFWNRSSQRVCRTWVLSRGSVVIWVVLPTLTQLLSNPVAWQSYRPEVCGLGL